MVFRLIIDRVAEYIFRVFGLKIKGVLGKDPGTPSIGMSKRLGGISRKQHPISLYLRNYNLKS